MESDLRLVIAKYGYRATYEAFQNIMSEDYTFLHSLRSSTPPPATVPTNEVVQVEAPKQRKPRTKKAVEDIPEIKSVTVQGLTNSLFGMAEQEIPTVIPEVHETPDGVKEVNVLEGRPVFKDSKEQKQWQKDQEEAKRRENEANGLTHANILTRENLKKWIEEEGKTYAWVAREKAGCPETQVAATAQMMGIKSKITKRRGMMMGKH